MSKNLNMPNADRYEPANSSSSESSSVVLWLPNKTQNKDQNLLLCSAVHMYDVRMSRKQLIHTKVVAIPVCADGQQIVDDGPSSLHASALYGPKQGRNGLRADLGSPGVRCFGWACYKLEEARNHAKHICDTSLEAGGRVPTISRSQGVEPCQSINIVYGKLDT